MPAKSGAESACCRSVIAFGGQNRTAKYHSLRDRMIQQLVEAEERSWRQHNQEIADRLSSVPACSNLMI